MRCNKCGEECGVNQTFCLKCGNRIQDIPDLNLIEEELANNIGELMDEMQEENDTDIGGTTRVFDSKSHIEDDILSDDSYTNTQDMNIPDIKDDSLELIEMAREHNANRVRREEYQVNALNSTRKSTKNKKKNNNKVIVAVVAVVFVIVAAVVIGIFVFGKKDKNKETFQTIYDEGIKLYTESEYDEAIIKFQKSVNMTEDEDELIKANKSLYDAYMKKGIDTLSDSEIHECVDILKELISLDKDNIDNYKNLIELYTSAKLEDELEQFKESLMGTPYADELGIKSVAAPVFEDEPGEYSDYISIGIKYETGCDVYYTLDGSEPTTESQLYDEPIEIKEQGTVVVKAVAVDSEGELSEILTGEFIIKLDSIDAPVVTPAGGKYNEDTKIEVQVPEGMKAYYTIDKYGITPTTESDEYTEPIDMPRGKYVFSVILVDESGMCSEVVENIYNYEVERRYSYDEAYEVLVDELIIEGTILDESCVMDDNGMMELSYKEISIIDNNEYYLIEGVHKSAKGKVVDTFIYGIDTVSGDMVIVCITDEGEYVLD